MSLLNVRPGGEPSRANGPKVFQEGGGTAVLDRPVADDAAVPEALKETEASTAITFADLGLSPLIQESILAVGHTIPTPIQERTIPAMTAGSDVIAQAQTGSGKTAAFGLPIIDAIDGSTRAIQAMILCPTRELAIQVSEALHKYGQHKHIETLPIYGGQPYDRQLRGLQRGVHIVVGTPGRVMDHMRRGTLKLENLKFFVLDEADEMLDMGFVEDIEWVMQQLPATRQTALFSATMPARIADLARKYMREPQRISVRGKEMTVSEVNQTYFEIPRQRKVDALCRILEAEVPSSAMIFCRTKHGVDDLGEVLTGRGFALETLHGDLSQVQRDRVMRRFRAGQAAILIATDVAARGLDIPNVSHVFNFDIPESPENYIHRIGRTGRAGKTGSAITMVTPRESRWIRTIERMTRARIEPRKLPSASDVNDRRREVLKSLVLDVVKDEENFSDYLQPIRDLAEDHDPVALAAAVLKLYATETGRSTTEVQKDDDVAAFSGSHYGSRESGMVRLTINMGRNFRVRPQDIVGAIANEANIPGRSIGSIEILDNQTLVDVPGDAVERVIAALTNASVKGQPVLVEVAADQSPRAPRGGRDGGPRAYGGRSGERPFRSVGPREGRSGGFGGQRRPDDNRGRRGGAAPDRTSGDRRNDRRDRF